MRYIIVKHQDGSFAILDKQNNALVIENESMGVCDAFIFAHTYANEYTELSEVKEAYERGRGKIGKNPMGKING